MNDKYTYIIGKARGNGGSSEGSLRYDQPQQLTAEQQKQAQENIGIDLSASLKREIVEALPATGEANIIYMVKRAETKEQNVYDEYMYINNAWEKIGSTDVDLSDYYTKEETDGKLEEYYTKEETDELINSIPKHWFGTQEEYDALPEIDPNTIYHIEGGGEDGGRKTFYLDIMNTTSYESKMQAAEIAQYAIQNQTTDFVVVGINGPDNTLTSSDISTNGVNELIINFPWNSGREIVTLTATSPTNINITRDGVAYATLQDIEDINNILETI